MVDLLDYVSGIVGSDPGPMFRPWGNIRRDLHDACRRAANAFEAEASVARAMGRTDEADHMARCAAHLRPGLSPNDLRRTHATWLRAGGVDLGLVARQLRHADTRMVSRVYARLDARTAGRTLSDALGCDTGVSERGAAGAFTRPAGPQKPREFVPRDGIEPPTRGFSVLGPMSWEAEKRRPARGLRRVV